MRKVGRAAFFAYNGVFALSGLNSAERASGGEREPAGSGLPILSTLEKGIRVLQEVVSAGGSLGVTEIARRVGINASTVYRILATYKAHGFVEQDGSNRYKAGLGLLKLAYPLLGTIEPRKVARPILERLVEEVRESANLMVPDGDRGLYVDSVQGLETIRMIVKIGTREYLHCSAVGKAILAFLPRERFERIVSSGLPKRTPMTITDVHALAAHLAVVRERGYAIDDEEGEEGTRCVGAPVFNGAGEVVAGISVSGPAFRMSRSRLDELAPKVKAAAAEISRLLGYNAAEE